MKVKYSLFSNLVQCPSCRAFFMAMMDTKSADAKGIAVPFVTN
jgi:hypothetical protein